MGANQSGGIVDKPDLEATAETTSSAAGRKVEEVIPVLTYGQLYVIKLGIASNVYFIRIL